MHYHFKVTKESKGYSGECLELSGCVSQGHSMQSLRANLEEALNLYLDEPEESKSILPFPRKRVKVEEMILVRVHSRVAFAFALRMTRLKMKLTQREAAAKIGMTGSLGNYQRLENSDTANPVLETLVQIKRAFPEFPLEEIAS